MGGLRRAILPVVLSLVVIGLPGCDALRQAKGPTLQVLSPGDFATVQLGETVDVVSTATDPKGVTRVELYVGEDLYRTDGSPTPEGETSWTFTQTWMPTAPGSYTLVVVAYNVDGVGSTPWAVAVEVVEGPATEGTPVSTTLPATGTPPPGATGTQPPPPSTGTVAPPPPTGTVPPPPPTGTAPPPPPTNTPVSPTPTSTPPPVADLCIAEISINPEQPSVGEELEVRVVIRNRGNAPSGVFGLAVLHAPPGPNIQLQVPTDHDPLPPGDARVIARPLMYSEPGLATIWVHIVPRDQDSEEDNNTSELVVNVLPGDLPDLYISRVSLDPLSPRVGEEVEVEIVVENAGPGDAGPFTVTWKSDPNTIACTSSVGGMTAGTSRIQICRYTYTYPHSGQSTYAKADANGDVDESNEDNNVRYLRVNVRPAA